MAALDRDMGHGRPAEALRRLGGGGKPPLVAETRLPILREAVRRDRNAWLGAKTAILGRVS